MDENEQILPENSGGNDSNAKEATVEEIKTDAQNDSVKIVTEDKPTDTNTTAEEVSKEELSLIHI